MCLCSCRSTSSRAKRLAKWIRGVEFYYAKVTSPATGSFLIKVTQSNDQGWPVIPTNKDQVLLYDANCIRVLNVKVGSSGDTVSITVNGYFFSTP